MRVGESTRRVAAVLAGLAASGILACATGGGGAQPAQGAPAD